MRLSALILASLRRTRHRIDPAPLALCLPLGLAAAAFYNAWVPPVYVAQARLLCDTRDVLTVPGQRAADALADAAVHDGLRLREPRFARAVVDRYGLAGEDELRHPLPRTVLGRLQSVFEQWRQVAPPDPARAAAAFAERVDVTVPASGRGLITLSFHARDADTAARLANVAAAFLAEQEEARPDPALQSRLESIIAERRRALLALGASLPQDDGETALLRTELDALGAQEALATLDSAQRDALVASLGRAERATRPWLDPWRRDPTVARETHRLAVLRGAPSLLTRTRQILIEAGDPNSLRHGTTSSDLLAHLESAGFQVHAVEGSEARQKPVQIENYRHHVGNWLALRG